MEVVLPLLSFLKGMRVQLVNRHLDKGGLQLRIVAEKLSVDRITCTTL